LTPTKVHAVPLCSSLACACDRPQPFPMSMCGVAAKNDCLTCCLTACSCSFMPRDKGGIGRTGKKVRAAAIRRATAAAPEQEGVGSSSRLGPPAGDASSTGTSTASRQKADHTHRAQRPYAPKRPALHACSSLVASRILIVCPSVPRRPTCS
jgi:hypothetical protein